jgi:hypothetical protein
VTAFTVQPGALLARGVCRSLMAAGAMPMMEFTPAPGLRVDVIALAPDGGVVIVECKSGLPDFRADTKWRGYLPWCDRFYFAVDNAFPEEVLPAEEGMIRADAHGAEIIREATARPLAPARRKALTLRLARKAMGNLRLMLDPACAVVEV